MTCSAIVKHSILRFHKFYHLPVFSFSVGYAIIFVIIFSSAKGEGILKNPLNKRIVRELKANCGKYLVIFIFMVVTIGLVSGYLVAADSMTSSLKDSFEQYQIEDGHFRLTREASDKLIARIEQENVTIHEDFYTECSYQGADGAEKKLRIFRDRSQVNKACIMEGTLPHQHGEIAIDRMYADNNQLSLGDTLTLNKQNYVICGLVSLSDYTSLFESNAETIFDALNFCVALVTPSDFDSFQKKFIHYNYAWRYNNGSPANTTTEKNQSDELSNAVVKAILEEEGGSEIAVALGMLSLGNKLEEFMPRYANQAVWFARNDIGGDRNAMLAFLYILIVVMAFIFGVTISHTITKEAAVIGTLRASGCTRGELFRQYVAMPVLITLISAIIGNICGYTLFKYGIAALYYNSYSLPTYITVWNTQAFILTTLIPILVMFAITSITLIRKLQLSPLAFIRRDLAVRKRKTTEKRVHWKIRLPQIGFFNRFRLRIIVQNKTNYMTLFFGILISTALLLFGLMLPPLLDDIADTAVETMVADYQYVLKEQTTTEFPSAEKMAVTTMKTYADGYKEEDVLVYGIQKDSRYIHAKLPETGVLISSGYADKYQLQSGDSILLKVPFENRLFELKVAGIFPAPTTINVYLSHDNYCDLFEQKTDYYNGYFSDHELTALSTDRIYSCITEQDMTKFSEQMSHSMGQMFRLLYIFAIILFVLVIYLLTKIILERNTHSISMVKILGYENQEISRLYLVATFWVMILSVLINFVLVTFLIQKIFVLIMKDYRGWIPFHMDFSVYVKAFVLSMGSYFIVSLTQMRHIQKIPMDAALKNVE